jgi:outer membrane receptor for ferrienterochelin and colicins
MIGNSFTNGNRIGGDIHVIRSQADSLHTYYEQNKTLRNTTTFEFNRKISDSTRITIKQSASIFQREIKIPNYIFTGNNINSFTDASYLHTLKKHSIIGGISFIADVFKEAQNQRGINRDNSSYTGGIYIQDTWDATERIKLEGGLRIDYVNYLNPNFNKSQTFILPRVSCLFKLTDKLSSRIGGGLGYKIPTIFTEQTETIQYRNVVSLNNVTAEHSYGGTADLNYKISIASDLFFSINHMFFLTIINDPLVLNKDTLNNLHFENASKPVQSMGFETNIKLIYKERLKLFVGYTYVDAKANYLTGNQFLPLVPRNKLNLALVYEKSGKFKIGLESYYSDSQYLTNGITTPSFWEFGAMAEKTFGKFSVFVNAENFTDTRQSRYKRVVNEPHNNPTFDDIWTHTEGFVFNGGIKIKLN